MKLKVRMLHSLWEKSVGLIGREHIAPIYFTTRWGIHTFGLTQPIDVVILDNEMRVREIKESLKPWRMFTWNPMYKHVLELPKGTLEKRTIKNGVPIHLIELT